MSFEEKYPTVAKVLTEAAVPRPRAGLVFAALKKLKVVDNQQVYRSPEGHLYAWDFTHGHWEVYSKRGWALRVVDNSGKLLKEFAASNPRKKLDLK